MNFKTFVKKSIKAVLPHGIVVLTERYKAKHFPGSAAYWEKRYSEGGNSGAGSYNRLAEFKASIINNFISEQNIDTVIEFGCGDGNQLSLAKYPRYIGFDVSKTAVIMCKKHFVKDNTKQFYLLSDYKNQKAEIVLSLDVIYHLIEDSIYIEYMNRLFAASTRYVVIYACDDDGTAQYHVHLRKFTKYIKENITGWRLLKRIPNQYPYDANDPDNTSWSDFYIYEKVGLE